MTLATIKELSVQIHRNNIEKGFWDEINLVRSRAQVICELAEAIEADRKGKYADLNGYYERIQQLSNSLNMDSPLLFITGKMSFFSTVGTACAITSPPRSIIPNTGAFVLIVP